jgi:hypothetical protein
VHGGTAYARAAGNDCLVHMATIHTRTTKGGEEGGVNVYLEAEKRANDLRGNQLEVPGQHHVVNAV